MSYLSILSADEIHYICSVIPVKDAISFFRHNPKEFAKIRPGFRTITSSISKMNIVHLLFSYRNRDFISFFIEKHINDWLKAIHLEYEKCLKNGDNKELALIRTLPFSFFAGNVGLYFKLTKQEYTEEFISLLDGAAKVLKETSDYSENQNEKLIFKDRTIGKLNTKIETSCISIEHAMRKLSQMKDEVEGLKRQNSEIEKQRATLKTTEQDNVILKMEILEQKERIRVLTSELSEAKNSRQLLEIRIREELERLQETKAQEIALITKPKCPSDVKDFKDYFGYNLKSLGVRVNFDYFSLLNEYLSKVLFLGIPIVVNRIAGMVLMQCVANTLIGHSNVNILNFKQGTSIEEVDKFLNSAGRIACLDNFIGNYNETELISLFDKHRGQIIFLTIAYDRTLKYVSEEFLRHSQYLNLNRIAAFSVRSELTEDPSCLDEIECTPQMVSPVNRYSQLLREMLNEFGYHKGLVEQKCNIISNETELCGFLAFDILPYCVDVLKIAPFSCSGRFNKYAGEQGKFPHKVLFKRWFS